MQTKDRGDLLVEKAEAHKLEITAIGLAVPQASVDTAKAAGLDTSLPESKEVIALAVAISLVGLSELIGIDPMQLMTDAVYVADQTEVDGIDQLATRLIASSTSR